MHSDSQRRSKLHAGHYRPGNSQSSGCCFRKALYEGKITLKDLNRHVRAKSC